MDFDGLRVCLLISGRGSTASAIIRHFKHSKIVRPVCAIASSHNADFTRLSGAGMNENDVCVVDPKMMKTSLDFGEAILRICKKYDIDLIGHYGWLVKTPSNVIEEYRDMIINQHPGPLDPDHGQDFGGKGMYGKRVHYTRLNFVREVDRDYWTEATCHRVTEQYDKGVIIDRAQVPITETDTVESLADKVLLEEHKLQIKVLEDFANNNVQEWHRDKALVKIYEEDTLNRLKQESIKAYPKG